MAKRLFDIFFSLVGLTLLCPVFFLVSLAIRLDSVGPAIFRQIRIGKNGVPFTIYKFRTMVVGADAQTRIVSGIDLRTFVFQKPIDSRTTRVGAFLRHTSVDELPQLFNVLLGTMSLVGPRPEIPAIVAFYSPVEKRRLDVKPGITGLAQVNGRGDLSTAEAIRWDLEYVSRQGAWTDLAIMAKTVRVVLSSKGAH